MEWNIRTIEEITEAEANELAEEKIEIKGHNIYFVDFKGYFGYSMLVYLNGGYIYYANDYQLHHEHMYKEKGKARLREWYIETANNKLFTETEIGEPLKTYDEYTRKSYYIHNYYPMQTERESIFSINPTEEEKAKFQQKIKGWTYNPVGFCYMPNKAFVERNIELLRELDKAKENTKDDFDYYKSAFLYEMYNHEYGINWEADYDTLSAFGNIKYHGENTEALYAYFDELEFTETQRKAYIAARNQYWENEKEAM